MNCLAFLLAGLLGLAVALDPLLVGLPNGQLRGRENDGYYSYESIPYARAPIGNLRFEPPQPFAQKWIEPFDATQPPVACLQWNQYIDDADKLRGSEDCLTVNIYRPKSSNRSTFPVLVNIHPGAFMFGDPLTQGHDYLMRRGNLIVVKIGYRLGPLGFLSTGDSVLPGNFGLKDQRLALEWIKENIVHFGGEPDNIMILGCSAGGASVHLQMLQEDFAHLAKVAVSISGNALSPWVIQQGARRRAFELGRIVGCGLLTDSFKLKECLRQKGASEIVRAVPQLQVFDYVPFTPFGPAVEPEDADQPFITRHPIDLIKSGKFSQVPWLTSFTEEDGAYNAAILLAKQSNGKEFIEELNKRWFDLAPHFFFYRNSFKKIEEMDNYSRYLRQHYLGDRSFSVENYFDVQRIFTDVIFRNDTLRSVQLHRKFGRSPVYLYVYDTPAEQGSAQRLAKRTDIRVGAGHADDFLLIFDSLIRKPLRADEERISERLMKMLESFVQSKEGSLSYDNCEFPDNVGQKELQFVLVRSNGCAISQLNQTALRI